MSKRKSFIIIILIFLFSPLFSKENPKYYLSICAIFRDEARFLKEWIEFHRMIGVEHFYLFNNLSEDNYKEILEPYIKKGIVELFEWPYENQTNTQWVMDVQCPAYNSILTSRKRETFWLAVIDVDEFIILKHEWDLAKFLKDYEEFAALGINWQLYGTSNVWEIPENQTMIGTLTYKCPTHFGHNHHIKCILQPKSAKKYYDNTHHPIFKKRCHCVDENKKKIPGAQSHHINVNKICLNHYTLHDEKFYYEVKLLRSVKWDPNFEIVPPNPHFNSVFDPIASRFLPELEMRLFHRN